MELTLNIGKDTAKKIQALSILADCNAADITDFISTQIDSIITAQLLQVLGLDRDLSLGPQNKVSEEDFTKTDPIISNEPEIVSEGQNIPQKIDSDDEDEDDEEGPMMFGVADSMGQKIDEVEDEVLPDEFQQEIKEMAVKTKDGEETGYTDEIMADAQAMADGEFSGQEDVIAAAAGSLEGAAQRLVSTGDDSPKEEGGVPSSTPDVLPVDLGIDKASSDGGGMDFFNMVLEGEKGNKSARNRVTRKKRK